MPFRQLGSGRTERSPRMRFTAVVAALVVLLAFAAAAQATHLFSDVAGHTTLERVITGADPADGYATLDSQPVTGSYVVRDGAGEANPAIPDAEAGRESRRRSLSYFGQLTDFQLADEESPARVEFTEQEPSGFAASAWRPQEALQPFIIDWSIRQMNLFAGASPVQEGDGGRAAMDFALHDRRPGRQHAAQRDPLDAGIARRRERWTRTAAARTLPTGTRSRTRVARPTRRTWLTSPRRRSTPASRTTATTTRGSTHTSTTPPAHGPVGGLAGVPRFDGPRAAAVPGCRPERPELCDERKP